MPAELRGEAFQGGRGVESEKALDPFTAPLGDRLLGLLGTKDQVPPKPFSSSAINRKALECFSKKKGTDFGFLVPPAPVGYEELRRLSAEAAVRFPV